MAQDTRAATYDEYNKLVNMFPSELKKWLDTENSQSVGIKRGTMSDKKTSKSGGESTGHESGRHILELSSKKKSDLNNDDYKEMRRISGYIKRHLAQKPSSDIKDSRWRYSLMNWGHDPLK